MSELSNLQELINTKKLDPFDLAPEEEAVINNLFREKKLTGYRSVGEMKQERKSAQLELAQEAERADTPIETYTRENLPIFGEVNRTTFETVGDITGSLMPYFKDKNKLQEAIKNQGYKNNFGIAFPDRFIRKTASLGNVIDKVTLGAKTVAGATPLGRLARLGAFFKRTSKNAKRAMNYGASQQLRTESKSVVGGAIGAGLGSAAYDVADFTAEFATDAQLDLGDISDNEYDKMAMPVRLLSKSFDAAKSSLMWGAGASALSPFIGSGLRNFGRIVTGTSSKESKALAEQAQRGGLPLNLMGLANEETTLGMLTKNFGKTLGVLPFVSNVIKANRVKTEQQFFENMGQNLKTLGPLGFTDLMGKEVLDVVKKRHANNMGMVDAVYKQLDTNISAFGDASIIPMTTVNKYITNFEEALRSNTKIASMLDDPFQKGFAGAANPSVEFMRIYKQLGQAGGEGTPTLTFNQFKGLKEQINRAINMSDKNDRIGLNIRGMRDALDTDFAKIADTTVENIEKIQGSEAFKTAAKRVLDTEGKEAYEKYIKSTAQDITKLGDELKEANDFYFRMVSPYSEGFLKNQMRKADSNLFTAHGELGLAGQAMVNPNKMMDTVRKAIFSSDAGPEAVSEFKFLLGANVKGSNGEKLFNAMRSRHITESFIKSFKGQTDEADNILDAIKQGFSQQVDAASIRANKRTVAEQALVDATPTGLVAKEGQVQTMPLNELKIPFKTLGDFDIAAFRKNLGMDSVAGLKKLATILPGGADQAKNIDSLLKTLQVDYGSTIASPSTYLARRAGLTGLSGVLGLGAATGAAGMAIGGGIASMIMPMIVIRQLGSIVSDPKYAKGLLDVYSTAERKANIEKRGILSPFGAGYSPRKRITLTKLLANMFTDEGDSPGTNPMKVTNQDVLNHLLKTEQESPIESPSTEFDPSMLPQNKQAEHFPEFYRLQKMDNTTRASYLEYLKGSKQSVAETQAVQRSEIETARVRRNQQAAQQFEQAQPQVQTQVQPQVEPQVQPQGQPQTQINMQTLFPNDPLSAAIEQRGNQ